MSCGPGGGGGPNISQCWRWGDKAITTIVGLRIRIQVGVQSDAKELQNDEQSTALYLHKLNKHAARS